MKHHMYDTTSASGVPSHPNGRRRAATEISSTANNNKGVARWLILLIPLGFAMVMYWKFHQQLAAGGEKAPYDLTLPFQPRTVPGKLEGKIAANTVPSSTGDKKVVASSSASLLEQTLKYLPDVSSPPLKGGIIVFQHIVKTGGTTIRDNFKQFPNVDYKEIFANSRFKKIEEILERKFDEHNNKDDVTQPLFNKTIFIEIHGRNTPTLIELVPILQKWKQQANDHNIPFKTFTLLRNPLDMSISFFNHFHVFGDSRFGDNVEGTLENFKQYGLRYANPQCLYLYRGERAYIRPRHLYNVTLEDCQQIQQLLLQNMDWIGDTKNLSYDTLPLLTYWITGKARHATTLQNSNVAAIRQQKHQPISIKSIDTETIELIRSNSLLDQSLYENAISPLTKLKELAMR